MRSPIRRHRYITLLAALVVIAGTLAGAPTRALAVSGTPVIADCNSHDTLTRTYGVAQLEAALQNMPAEVQEYTNCQDVIKRAILAQEGKLHRSAGSGNGGSSSGSFLPTPLIVVLALLLVAATVLAALAVRRRRMTA